MLRYVLLGAAILVAWRGVTKLDLKTRRPVVGGPWGTLLLWAALLAGSVLVWMLYPPPY